MNFLVIVKNVARIVRKSLTSKWDDIRMKDIGISASRGPPKKCEPLVHKGIRYEAPWGRMGYIEAYDNKSEVLLWDLKVYSVDYVPELEQDVQARFITSLQIKHGRLHVVAEGNERYVVHLDTKEIRKE